MSHGSIRYSVDMRITVEWDADIPMFVQTATNVRSIRVALIPVMMLLPSCKDGNGTAEFWENEREAIELAQHLKLNEYRLGLLESGKVEEM